MIYNRNDINIPKGDLPDLDNEKKYIELYQKNLINSYPSLFIFLIDQSGSMSGKPINIVKESLLFFLQSLPKNSYYQLIGFGSSMKYISSEEPLEYTVENVKKTIEKVKKLKANLGGTELYKPLQNIFSNENSDNLNLCKNLFILTDGEVWDREKSLKIIKNNLDVFRVHSFGIGNSFDEKFIVESGKNGSYNFIKDIDKIKSSVIQTLNKALRNYLYDFKIDVKNIDTEYNYFPKQKIYYQDELLNYYFIIKHKLNNNININIEYYDKKELINKEINFDNNNIFISENDGDIISKIIIGNILNNTDLPQDKNIELSKRYQVLSKYTSLYAEVENEKSTQNEMLKIEQKKLEEIEESESDSDNDIKKPKPKKRRKCNRKKKVESDSDSESDSGKKYKKRKCMKKCKKISNDSESDEKEEKNRKKKKCKKNLNDSESDEGEVKECKNVSNDSESDEGEEKIKYKKSPKKCRKISNDSESDEKEEKNCKKKKCRKISNDSESDEGQVKECKNVSNDSESDEKEKKKCKKRSKKCKNSESDEKEKKKCKKRSKKCRNISNESDEKEVKKFIKNKCKKKLSDSESEEEDENDKHSNKKTKKVFDVKEMTLTQNIIDGNWSINSQTQFLINSYDDIYNKIKKYVNKLDVGQNKEDIIVTVLVLYYLKNNKDIDQTEYLLIINKGLQYLKNLGIKEFLYENIESNIK